jgi:hypothetical protein
MSCALRRSAPSLGSQDLGAKTRSALLGGSAIDGSDGKLPRKNPRARATEHGQAKWRPVRRQDMRAKGEAWLFDNWIWSGVRARILISSWPGEAQRRPGHPRLATPWQRPRKTWMPGSSPGMTTERVAPGTPRLLPLRRNAIAPKKLAAHAGYAFTTHAGVSRFRLGGPLYLELD